MLQKMENYQGDLADVIRAGCTPINGTLGTTTISSSSSLPPTIHNWQFSQPSDPMAYDNADDFGHPFSNTRDPLLLEELDSTFFTSLNSIDHHQDDSSVFSCGASSNMFVAEKNTTNIHIEDQQQDQMKRATTPCNTSNSNCNNNIFERVLQISPHIISDVKQPISSCKSPVTIRPRIVIKPPPPSPQPFSSISICNDHANNNMMESTGVQVSSSTRNMVLKRRKSQLAKKVVCIPAPAPANSRPTGETVPSDLWAWRKYGQKPIKGSPYPRGYYRCSSSKGCSARKQVERSRADPNMLVITYTSEHNHPWPTQRNVLAGSTRSTQPTKTINTKVHSPTSLSQKGPLPTSNEQQQQLVLGKDSSNIVDNVSASIDVKEEEMDDYGEKEMIEMDKKINEEELGFPNHDHYQTSYRPEMPNSIISHADQDLFADLEEIEADPLKLMFTQGSAEEERGGNNKAVASLGPFSFYDWTGNSINNNFTSFGDQARRGL